MPVACPAGAGDVALLTVTLAGRTTPDGRDLRLVNAQGEYQPFEILHHDAELSTLLHFRVPENQPANYWLYYGNPGASILPSRGPAGGDPPAWMPRRGLVLQVYRKATAIHPRTTEELYKLIAASTLEGAEPRLAVSDGFNPVGDNQNYLSVYTGYLRIDRPGSHRFCTVSSDGSLVVINGQQVVAWPGAHGWGGAERGQHNGQIDLQPGVALVQYYQEKGPRGPALAFLGWQPPSADHFQPIPQEQWLSVRQAQGGAPEARHATILAAPQLEIANTYWVRETQNMQATLVEFHSRSFSRTGQIVTTTWSFGDGLTAGGAQVRHVYFRLGRPKVTLTVTDEQGHRDSVAIAPNIFLIEVQSNYYRYGNSWEYTRAVENYDLEKMAGADLAMDAQFWEHTENWPRHIQAARTYLRRFPDGPAAAALAASAATACAQPAAYDPAEADRLYQLALEHSANPEEKAQLTLQRAQMLAWGLRDYGQAQEQLKLLRNLLKDRRDSDLHRRSLILAGDLALLQQQYAQARDAYLQAQALSTRKIPQAEQIAKIGSYPYAVEDLLARNEYEYALKALDQWEDVFPTQKLEGLTSFLRGKVLFIQQPGMPALRYLELAREVRPQALHVPEALWLHANCLLALHRYQEALAELQHIRNDFTRSDYFQMAPEKIKFCEEKLRSGPGVEKNSSLKK